MNDNNPARKEASRGGWLFSGGGGTRTSYKFWVLFAALLLALWSMFTGSVTLKWSLVGNLSRLSDDFKTPNFDDLDILEVDEREKVVRHMWDLYAQSRSAKLPRFWREAFEAAYENLVSDVPGVRDLAFSEIAKMSIFSVALDPLPDKPSQGTRDQSRKMAKHTEKKKEVIKPSKKKKKEEETTSKIGDEVESEN